MKSIPTNNKFWMQLSQWTNTQVTDQDKYFNSNGGSYVRPSDGSYQIGDCMKDLPTWSNPNDLYKMTLTGC